MGCVRDFPAPPTCWAGVGNLDIFGRGARRDTPSPPKISDTPSPSDIKGFRRRYEKYEKLADHLTGMTGFAFTSTNPVAPAKIINKYFGEKEKLSLKACYIEGEYYDSSHLKTLATLPSKNELIAGILGRLKSPISGVAGGINAIMRDLVSVIDAVSKKNATQ